MNSCTDGTEPLGEAPDLPGRTPPAGTDRPLVFLDTETLGLDPAAPIWEFGAIRVRPGFSDWTADFTILHDPGDYLEKMAASSETGARLAEDYRNRYRADRAWSEFHACTAIHRMTKGAIVVGCNPAFDLDSQRLAALLRRNNIEPEWHYHPLDTASMALAWLWARGVRPPQPWKSDELSRLIGVDPEKFGRHSALGDATWCRAQWVRMQSAPTPAAGLEDWIGKARRSE